VSSPVGGGWRSGADHRALGTGYLLAAFVFFAVGGVLGLVLRTQLVGPHVRLVGDRTYRQLFTLHGIVTTFLFLMPAWIGLAGAIVPKQIGAARLAFPRLNGMALWLFVSGGAMIVLSPFVSGGTAYSGWSLSSPVPEGRAFAGHGPDLVILGLGIVMLAVVLATTNLITTILKMRGPEVTLGRLAPFTWSVLVSSSVLLLAAPVLGAALLLLFVDRHYGGHAFSGFTGSGGGNPQLLSRMFWFFAYPARWALLLPALGVACEIVPNFLRRPLRDGHIALRAMGAIGVLSFVGWGAEVTNLPGSSQTFFALAALVVLLPTAAIVACCLATIKGKDADEAAIAGPERDKTPMRHAVGVLAVVGLGLVGAAIWALASGSSLHGSAWATASPHVLFFGAGTIGVVAAVHYWAPSLWGRHLSEELGSIQLILLLGGVVFTFGPLYVAGLQGMGLHMSSYLGANLGPVNLIATAGAYLTGLALLVLWVNMLVSVGAGKGRVPEQEPTPGAEA